MLTRADLMKLFGIPQGSITGTGFAQSLVHVLSYGENEFYGRVFVTPAAVIRSRGADKNLFIHKEIFNFFSTSFIPLDVYVVVVAESTSKMKLDQIRGFNYSLINNLSL